MFSLEEKLKAARLTARGFGRAEIAHALRISLRCLDKWRADPQFRRAVAEAQDSKADRALVALVQQRGERGRREKGWRCFRDFVPPAWATADPASRFVANWHIGLIADHLQAVSEGRLRRLLITVPPDCGSSRLVSTLWPAWQWLRKPAWRGVFAAPSAERVLWHSLAWRRVINSEWYRSSYTPQWRLAAEQAPEGYWANDANGFRLELEVGAEIGECSADCLVIDDPLDGARSYSEAELRQVNEWFVRLHRRILPEQGAVIIVMHRVAPEDLAGHVLGYREYVHLELPSEFDPDRRSVTKFGRDIRERKGELLFPSRYDQTYIQQEQARLGSEGYATQHQQRPRVAEGAYFARYGWKFWQQASVALPPVRVIDKTGKLREAELVVVPTEVEEQRQSWHCVLRNATARGLVMGQLWGIDGPNRYLLDQVHGSMDFAGAVAAIRKMCQKWPESKIRAIEFKCGDHTFFRRLAAELPDLRINPVALGSDRHRAGRLRDMVQCGVVAVYLPHPRHNPSEGLETGSAWVWEMIEQCAEFPHGRRDEWVEAMTLALY